MLGCACRRHCLKFPGLWGSRWLESDQIITMVCWGCISHKWQEDRNVCLCQPCKNLSENISSITKSGKQKLKKAWIWGRLLIHAQPLLLPFNVVINDAHFFVMGGFSGKKNSLLTKAVGHLCHRTAGNPCLWVWEAWEHGFGHRASLSQWGTEQNLHTIRENRFRFSSWITVPAGNTLSSIPADRLMVTLNPAVPQPISGPDLNPQVSAGKQRQEQFLDVQECCEPGKAITDRLQLAQTAG